MAKTKKNLMMLALWLVIVGGLNWGLVGLFNFNLVAYLIGMLPSGVAMLENVIYIIVGISAGALGIDKLM